MLLTAAHNHICQSTHCQHHLTHRLTTMGCCPALHKLPGALLAASSDVLGLVVAGISGLRSLQGRQQLHELVSFVKSTRDNLDWGPAGSPPLLVKIAPDLTDADKADIAAVVLDTAVDGLVVSNTTLSRPGEHPRLVDEGIRAQHGDSGIVS
eukprot:GHUV01031504.1.p1 GENE.GHUV01031504.1~~GHUV01031504.1.p1  ORF type:complete len:152 (-),score=43.38 GHUV01031504.1:198-653(-)